ncbi:MAG: hypothetical protein U9R60_14415 [Bacteroidota bacterium]|nr:hypothetical protein [Bacteroidota bacterium]
MNTLENSKQQIANKILESLRTNDPILQDPGQLTDSIMNAIQDKRPASNRHPGTISLVYKLLLAATVCLLMVFGVEQYLFVDRVQKLEDRASSITKEHTKKPGFKIIFSLNTGIKFEYVETLLKPDESKIFKKGIKTRLKLARLSALDMQGFNLKGLKQLNNIRMNPDQQHSGSFN